MSVYLTAAASLAFATNFRSIHGPPRNETPEDRAKATADRRRAKHAASERRRKDEEFAERAMAEAKAKRARKRARLAQLWVEHARNEPSDD